MDTKTIGKIVLIVAGVAMFISALLKFIPGDANVVTGVNMGSYLLLVILLQVVGGILLLIPDTRTLGVLWTTAYFGAAINAHLVINDLGGMFMPSILLLVLWLGYVLYKGNVK